MTAASLRPIRQIFDANVVKRGDIAKLFHPPALFSGRWRSGAGRPARLQETTGRAGPLPGQGVPIGRSGDQGRDAAGAGRKSWQENIL